MAEQQEENTIFVGQKAVKTYLQSIATQFDQGNESVFLKARGNAISNAVSVSNVATNGDVSGLTIPESLEQERVETGEAEIETDDGEQITVPTIEIEIAG